MYIIVQWEINGLNGGLKHSPIMTMEEYEEAKENGEWSHSSMGPLYFDTLEEAEKYLKKIENMYVVARCTKLGFEDVFIDSADNENIYSQPSIYDILFEGTYAECQKYLEEELEEE